MMFFFPSHNCVSLLSRLFFHQPWSSEFPILQQNLCFVAAVCSHYVLFSLNCDCAHLFTAPCAHPAVQGPKYCCLGASTASPRVAQKGWVWNFSHALLCSCWVPAFFLHSKKKGGAPESRKDPQSTVLICRVFLWHQCSTTKYSILLPQIDSTAWHIPCSLIALCLNTAAEAEAHRGREFISFLKLPGLWRLS